MASSCAWRWQRWTAITVTLLLGCGSAARAPVAYYVPAAAEEPQRRDAARCLRDCQLANADEERRFNCIDACSGTTSVRNKTCAQLGDSTYVACAEREETLRDDKKKRSKTPWALIAGIGAGVLGFVFIATSPLFRERSGN
jgi:hypothetical protein